ncbi:MAG: hypothetical protein ACD_20C00085G0029 [uncultured bacterium]|nr:MAG: hypothetical protein ACD_20C00085G0029 [uncultured bacterium]
MGKKRALISVYDKRGIVDFARELVQKYDYEIISTGGTYETLKENGIEALEVSSVTEFPELLGGKVKTLHPKIFAGILTSRTHQDELNEIKEKGITPVDMVVVNLYPFEEASKDYYMELQYLIQFIDIGGVSLLRAAAKNYFYVASVYSPDMYEKVLAELEENIGNTTYELRKELAINTFQYTSSYDAIIAEQFYARTAVLSPEHMPDIFNLSLKKKQELRYGENPHQKAALYKSDLNLDFEVLHGKELSYNNLVDLTAALNIVSEFIDMPAACVIKHNNPCGVALGNDITEAYIKAFNCDPISAFGGIIGLNEPVTKQIAELAKDIFLEVIVAPDFTEEALEILKSKKNLRLVKIPVGMLEYRYTQKFNVKNLPFGTLVQTMDQAELSKDTFNVVTSRKPTAEQVEDMLFAWKVVKHVGSNAIVVAKNKMTIGIGMGQTSRIVSMEIALSKACDETKDAVIASDGFFPAVDNIYAAAQERIGAIIQPGGSIKDQDVIAEADKYDIAMICTGIRHFRH